MYLFILAIYVLSGKAEERKKSFSLFGVFGRAKAQLSALAP